MSDNNYNKKFSMLLKENNNNNKTKITALGSSEGKKKHIRIKDGTSIKHHIKFGNKMFCSLEDIIWTNSH